MGFKSDANKLQSHGMTVAQMNEIKSIQTSGESHGKITANKNANYEINEHEKHLVHVLIEDKEEWIRDKKISKPRIQKFYKQDYDAMSRTEQLKGEKKSPQKAFAMYDNVEVIHYPRANGEKDVIQQKSKVEKELTEMSLDQLQEKYESIFGESADEAVGAGELIRSILDYLKG